MAFDVRFDFLDAYNRVTTRTWHNTNALVADVLTDVGVLAGLINAISDGGLSGVTITQKSSAAAFAAVAGSSIDSNASVKVLAGDGYHYDVNIPMPIAGIINPDSTVDLTAAGVTAFFAEFASGDTWRINLRAPTDIVTLVSGVLDK